jgi:hypothetical protein
VTAAEGFIGAAASMAGREMLNSIIASDTSRRLDVDDAPAVPNRITTKAVDFAASRAAELVGRKYNEAGELVENPNAQWAINDTTRDWLKGEIRDAVALQTG